MMMVEFFKISPVRMVSSLIHTLAVLSLGAAIIATMPAIVSAQSSGQSTGQATGASGLPLPRFVTLKAHRVNMRVGPGRDYQVQWLYVRKSLPMEVLQEFGNWRKVRDPNGVEGWVLHSLLSNKRAVMITPWDMRARKNALTGERQSENSTAKPAPTVAMHASPTVNSRILAQIEAGKLAIIDECKKGWCGLNLISENDIEVSGYVDQSLLWGVYPDENAKN